MARSKRTKQISLTKTKKNPTGHKQKVQTKLNECVQKYKNIILFSHENMTTIPFREIQAAWNDSRYLETCNTCMPAYIIYARNMSSSSLYLPTFVIIVIPEYICNVS